jgi:hypothetical protein
MRDQSPSSPGSRPPVTAAGNRVRAAALAAALVPLAQVAATPVTVLAQASGGTTGTVPEPASLVLLAPAAAWLVRRHLKK